MKRKLLSLILIIGVIFTFNSLVIAAQEPIDQQGIKFAFNNNKQKPWITDSDKIKERIDKITKGMSNAYSREKSWKAIDDYFKSQGMEVISPSGIVDPDSTNTQVNIYQPSVYYDPGTGLYALNASWTWKKDAKGIPYWWYDITVPEVTANMGGYDGAGLWISNPTGITLKSNMYLVTYDYNLKSYTTSTPWDWTNYGAAFKAQDKSWPDSSISLGHNYNWHSGTVVVWVSATGSGSTYLKTTLGHDWKTTLIDSVTINSGGLTFTFKNGSNYWQGTSTPVTWSR